VADRTGHKSSAVINRYRRAARTWGELALGELVPHDLEIPEFAPFTRRITRRGRSADSPRPAWLGEFQRNPPVPKD
jgi:hypothetical protein